MSPERIEKRIMRKEKSVEKLSGFLQDRSRADSAQRLAGLMRSATELFSLKYAASYPSEEVTPYIKTALQAGVSLFDHQRKLGRSFPDCNYFRFRLMVHLSVLTGQNLGFVQSVVRREYEEPSVRIDPTEEELLRLVLQATERSETRLTTRLDALIDRCGLASASKEDRTLVLPLAKGLQSILRDDAEALEAELRKRVDLHHRSATRGELRFSYEGILCLPSMAVAQIALDRGLSVADFSGHLGFELLRKEGKLE